MKNLFISLVLLFWVALRGFAAEPPADASYYWPQWRGPQATGVAPHASPPLEWGESRNIRWKLKISGEGSSSPVIWEDQVFILTAVPTGEVVQPVETSQESRRGRGTATPTQVQKFAILAINRQDGKILWEEILREELPHESKHATGSWASNSPVTDGEHVFAFFGSRGLYGFDMEGNPLWDKDLGDMAIRRGFGEGASPVLHGDKIIVLWDHQGQSFIVALDKKTGREIWRTDRDEITSWTTPIVVKNAGREQIITVATNRVRSYDLESGQLVWESDGMTLNTIPSPVAAEGMVFATSGYQGNSLLAIRLADARGDITDSGAIVWKHDRDTPYVPSPLLYRDTLYFMKRNSGVISSFNAKAGTENYKMRLRDIPNVYASPVAADDRIYVAGREGTTVVLEHGPQFKILAVNSLEDGFDASPALVDGEIYLRGHQNLYCISVD